ncbi:SMI1/KNR4 family protein [Allorhizobium taibaishanense]|uniref:Cell wall assembly regulator SMI1 n=1 Tax=Allorhizobium taibaishanense TaxID=887144 RepID=A0A1Q9AB59_9HYPH|nr:SMI1/KNR4 family protein [Allorhizobium taibaishanense]MBB4010110.1 cell wall assembly regulator SMI1 [Allorhizobium taibaishanense]OLP52123.1 hypothetical protein BJF91_02455 [Allorhizobium taibaishanense]
MMESSFEIIARWLEQHDPDAKPHFNEPASEGQIVAVESRLGQELPPSVRSLYLLANGQPYNGVGLEGAFTLMSLDEVVETFGFLNGEFPDGINTNASDDFFIDADPGMQANWWSRRWIPIMQNGGGDYLCADLDPAEGGTFGQIVAYYHDENFRSLVSSGIDALMEGLAQRDSLRQMLGRRGYDRRCLRPTVNARGYMLEGFKNEVSRS